MDSEEAVIETLPEVPTEVPATTEESPFEELPVLAVRDTVIFPGALLPLTVGRPASVALVESLGENRLLGVISQLDPRTDSPGPDDLHQTGTVCVMHKAMRVPKDNLLLFCEGVARHAHRASSPPPSPFCARASSASARYRAGDHAGTRRAAAECAQRVPADCRRVAESFRRSFARRRHTSPRSGGWPISSPAHLPRLSHAERQTVLEQIDAGARLDEINAQLTRELELLELRRRSNRRCRGSFRRASASSICASN